MIYRELGNTGSSVSILGFGTLPLGNEFGAIEVDEGQRAVHSAIDRGINYFDVAPYYGRTLAETRLDQALVGYRDKIILATIVGRYGKDPDTGFNFSSKWKEQIINETLLAMIGPVANVCWQEGLPENIDPGAVENRS